MTFSAVIMSLGIANVVVQPVCVVGKIRMPSTSSLKPSFRHQYPAYTQHMSPMNTSRGSKMPCASAAQSSPTAADQNQLIPELIEFLKEDLTHLFDNQGIDRTKYEKDVTFEDPITRHTSLNGYLANIAFLKTVFDPSFKLLGIRQTGPYEITTRWSMEMKPTFVRLPALQNLWNPALTFTGTSIMSVNPATGRFNRHVDTWDAIQQQGFFSTEAFTHMMSQVFSLQRTPQGLETPKYTVLRKTARYEVRQYDSFTVAQLPYSRDSSSMMVGSRAFGSLAGYIFGKNAEQQKMEMTTPVFSSTDRMQFYLGPKMQSGSAPAPIDPSVEVLEVPENIFAVASFGGLGDEGAAETTAGELKRQLAIDGVQVVPGAQWMLARYNDPATLPPFRRNEVMLPLQDFKLW